MSAITIKKAIIPAAGLGTRFLPLTSAIPKELLPIMNTPAIQYIVTEAVTAHINDLYIITNDNKPALAHYLNDKKEAHFSYITQAQPRGLGHAILQAHAHINNEYTAVLLPDDIIIADQQPAIAQMAAIAERYNASVIAVQNVAESALSSYGVIEIGTQLDTGIFSIKSVVEKPAPGTAPSSYAILGRYILSPEIFTILGNTPPSTQNEIQLTDAIATLIAQGHPVIACEISGNRFDIGTPTGWLHTILHIAQNNPTYKPILEDFYNKQR